MSSSPNSPLRETKNGSRGIEAEKLFKTQSNCRKNYLIAYYIAQNEVRISVQLLANLGRGCTTLTATHQAPKRAVLEATGLFFFDRHFHSFCAGLAL